MKTYAATITHEATLNNFVGEHVNGSNKEVVCITTRQRWASVTDAAIAEGVCLITMSRWVNGKATPRNGKQYCLASELNKHLDTMLAEDADYEELKRKAALWDAHMAEQEEKRKQAESLQQAVDKAMKALELKKRIREEQEAKCQQANEREMKAGAWLAKLQNMSPEEWAVSPDNPKVRQAESNHKSYEKRKANNNEN